MITATDPTIDLFTLRTNICGDCGASFETSRPARLCALCAGPRATVACPACGLEHQVPVLAPTKLCGPCRVDPVMTRMSLESRLAAAQCRADEAWLRLDADVAHADAADRARYDAACEKAAEWSPERWAKARDAAIAKGDGLSPLLTARQRWDEAAATLDQVRAAVEVGLEEVGGVC